MRIETASKRIMKANVRLFEDQQRRKRERQAKATAALGLGLLILATFGIFVMLYNLGGW